MGRVSDSDDLTVDTYEYDQDVAQDDNLINNVDPNYNFDGLLEEGSPDNVDETVFMENSETYNEV